MAKLDTSSDAWHAAMLESKEAATAQERQEAYNRVLDIERAWRREREYQPKTGQKCHCRPGVQRDNCLDCEGTGMRIDFARIRRQNGV